MKNFQCRVGHKYSPESFLFAQAQSVERMLTSATRALEEHGSFTREMANLARKENDEATAASLEKKAWKADQNAELIRRMLAQEDLV